MSTIKIKLKDYLHQHGLSAYRLAKCVHGVSPKTVYAVSAGRARPSLDALGRIVEALRAMTGKDITPGDILEFAPPTIVGRNHEARVWFDAGLDDMVQGIEAAEAMVPSQELSDWLRAMATAVLPLDAKG